MSAHKHTPGPWELHESVTHVRVVAADGENIWFEDKRCPRVIEDARLIAAAPELLAEVQQAVIQMEMAAECIQSKRYDEALLHVTSLMRSKRAAIAKATGEPA